MNKRDILRLARDSGMGMFGGARIMGDIENFRRFIRLVAQAERNKCARVCVESQHEWFKEWERGKRKDKHLEGMTDAADELAWAMWQMDDA